jgi:hypothetical protein
MKRQKVAVTMFALTLAVPAFAAKKHNDRAMIEKMEAVPCGAKERGLTGLGSVWASIGLRTWTLTKKLCPQYMLRTDDMEYHVRPLDHKHPVILPVGKEGVFKISKDVMEIRIPDGASQEASLPSRWHETHRPFGILRERGDLGQVCSAEGLCG